MLDGTAAGLVPEVESGTFSWQQAIARSWRRWRARCAASFLPSCHPRSSASWRDGSTTMTLVTAAMRPHGDTGHPRDKRDDDVYHAEWAPLLADREAES
jgi:hypothetical protein